MKSDSVVLFKREITKNYEIQTGYLLFYQYFQYYQISNYPQQVLDIQPYDMPSILQSYKEKSTKNIGKLQGMPLNNLIEK